MPHTHHMCYSLKKSIFFLSQHDIQLTKKTLTLYIITCQSHVFDNNTKKNPLLVNKNISLESFALVKSSVLLCYVGMSYSFTAVDGC